jgi:hypothetical protein
MSYRILSSNVIVGDANANIPFYSLITTPGGEFQIERLDGNASILSVGGNVSADHMILSSLATQNRVITTDSAGRFILTNFDANGLGNATALTTGVIPSDRLQGSYTLANLTASGTVTANTLVGTMDASNITSGVLPAGRLSGDYSFANLVLSDTLTASTLTANISANDLTSGTLSDDRLSGGYAFDSLSLTGNLAAAWLNANINAANITIGTLPDDRLQGAYTFDALTVSNVLSANNVNIPTLLGSNVLISNGNGYIVSSNVTQTELGFVSGVVSPIQTQINQLANGNIVGSNIANLDANNITIGTLPDGRLSGSYTFENLTLSGNLVANTISGNLNASQLTSGIVPSGRLAGDYTIGNLTASTVTASSVSGNLNASQLASGTVPDARLSGAYTFGSLTLTGNVTANTVHANIDAGSIASGTIDNARLDLENLTTNITPASAGLSIGTAGNTWTTLHADTVNVDDVLLGNSIMYNGNAVVVDLEQTTRNIVPTSTTYTIGKSGTPWSHVYAGNVIATDVIVSGQLLNSELSPYIDLSNVETNVVPVSGGLSIGTVSRPWQNVVANAATVQTLTINGNVTTSIAPSTTGLNLGSAVQAWGNVYADELHGNIGAADIYGELDANVIFTGGSIDDFVIKVPAGTAGQPGLRFTDDDGTGLFLSAVGNVGVSVDGQTSLTIDSSAATVSGNLVPSSNISYDLGSQANAWRDVHIANAIYAGPVSIVDGAVTGVGDVTSTGNVTAENVIASGSVSATTLFGNLDAGYLTSGTIDPARIAGDYSVATLTITGNANIGGTTTIQPSGHIIPAANLVYDLGSSTNVWRDIYLSGSTIHLGNATISETAGNVVISKLNISGSLTADGLQADLSISNVQICDSSWTPVDDTHVGLSDGYILVNGAGYAPGMLVQIGGTNAAATSYVSSTQLRVQTPAKSTGTYDVTVVRGDTKTATLTSAVSYSQDVVFTTASTLGPMYQYLPFTETITATSDSNVLYSNITALPVQMTLDANSGLLEANIGSSGGNVDTLFSFDLKAEDDELQDAIQTFLLQYYPFAAGKIVPSDSEASAQFGWSCSISSDGTRAIVGAYLDDATGGANSGAAYVFTRSGTSWVEESKLVASDSEAGARFGQSCSISGDGTRAIVGAVWDDATGGADSGAAYVFTRSGTSWVQESKLVASDSEAGARFGESCSISSDGTRAIVGAYKVTATGGSNSGAAYVFTRSGTSWVEESKLVPSDSEASAQFGSSCSISSDGTRAIVGARLDDATGGSNSGAAYVFTRSGTSWVEESKLVPSDSEASAQFGFSCSISSDGTRAIVGAVYDDATGGGDSGAAYVFTRSGTSWAEESKLVPSDSEAAARFGISCSISSDGTRAIVGANGDDATGGADSGAAYVFTRSGTTWAEEIKLVPSDSEAGAQFGQSCSISSDGTRAIVGAYLDDATGGADSGAAYLFQRTYTGWVETAP